jgi:Tfp pilus assembly protein PilN
MIRINLLPDVKLEYLRTKRTQARVISIATIVTIGVVALLVLMLLIIGGQAIRKSYLTTEIKKKETALKSVEDIGKYLTIQNQLATLPALHQNKSDLSRLFTYLIRLNPAEPNNISFFTNVELKSDDTSNVITFNGETKNYTSLTTFRDTLANAKLQYVKTAEDGKKETVTEQLFETVTVASSTLEKNALSGTVVTFKIEGTYNPNAFLASVEEPTLIVPNKTTTQSAEASPNVFNKSSVEKENQ